MFDIRTIKGVSRVICPWLCTFICDQLHHYGPDLEYGSLSSFVCVFDSMDEPLVEDRVYQFCDCPPSRVASLVRLVLFSFRRFSVVWDVDA